MIICFGISFDNNFIEIREFTLSNSDFKIDGIFNCTYFYGIDIRKEITVILIEVSNVISIWFTSISNSFFV